MNKILGIFAFIAMLTLAGCSSMGMMGGDNANPCNAKAMKHNPCNPCSMKTMKHNPCNPCSMKHEKKW